MAAEVAALAPYRPGKGLGAFIPLGPEADLQNAGVAFDARFLDPLIVAIFTVLVWVAAGLLLHAFATGLGGVGSFRGYLKLLAFVFAMWLVLLPVNVIEGILRLARLDQARDTASSAFVVLGICLIGYQIVLCAAAARVHYKMSTARTLGAVSLTLTTAMLIGGVLVILLLLWVALILSQGFGGACCL